MSPSLVYDKTYIYDKNSHAEHEVTGKTYNQKKRKDEPLIIVLLDKKNSEENMSKDMLMKSI